MYISACVLRILIFVIGLGAIILQCLRRGELFGTFVYFTLQSSAFVTICYAFLAMATLRRRPGLAPALKGAATLYILITCLVYNLVLSGHKHDGDQPPRPGGPPPIAAVVAQGAPPMTEGAPPEPSGPPAGPPSNPPQGTRWEPPEFMRHLPRPGLIMHIVIPLLVVLDWLFFDAHRRYRWRYAAIWMGYPFAYIFFLLVRHAIFPDSRFPYFFVDLDKIGYQGLALSTLICGVAFYILGLIIVGIDRLLPAAKGVQAAEAATSLSASPAKQV